MNKIAIDILNEELEILEEKRAEHISNEKSWQSQAESVKMQRLEAEEKIIAIKNAIRDLT